MQQQISAEVRAELERINQQGFGFLTKDDVSRVAEIAPSFPLLCRCGGGRFSAPAGQLDHFVAIVTREGSDYVRDVSFLAGTVARPEGGAR